ncbi:hypothetical protein [Desulfosporosinus sp. Sb-LF]|uniref:hypothetical protein n=1 Tax=Desulfosporosinus sp. Sb-LF TaxID=2560027 RepID=UPI001A7E8054|nr:hypothetical protein [Desulfosporosinus sp. Sb-LF]
MKDSVFFCLASTESGIESIGSDDRALRNAMVDMRNSNGATNEQITDSLMERVANG